MVNNRCSPIKPRNLKDDFVLDYDGDDVFATPSANMATVFQVVENLPNTLVIMKAHACLDVAATQTQRLRKENSAYRAHSSNHSARHGKPGEDVDQNDLWPNLNQRDLHPRINN